MGIRDESNHTLEGGKMIRTKCAMLSARGVILLAVILLGILSTFGSVYGVVYFGFHSPGIAYNPVEQKYLATYMKHNEWLMYKRLINPFGAPQPPVPQWGWGDDESEPAVAYDGVNNRFLLVSASAGRYPFLYGKLLNKYGYFSYPENEYLVISTTAHVNGPPLITFDSLNERFLVTWIDSRGPDAAIYGQIIAADGTLWGAEFPILHKTEPWTVHGVAYDHVNRKFLIAGVCSQGIMGQFVNADGVLEEGPVLLVDNEEIPRYPSLAYDGINQRYLLTWNQHVNTGLVRGRLIRADGTHHGDGFVLSEERGGPSAAAYDPVYERFLVAWTRAHTDGRFVDSEGTPQGEQFAISRKCDPVCWALGSIRPTIAVNGQCGNFLVASVSTYPFALASVQAAKQDVHFTVVGNPCKRAVLTVRKKGNGRKEGSISGPIFPCNGNPCAGTYIRGTTVNLTAHGSTFGTWTGCDEVKGAECLVTMDKSKAVTATFLKGLSDD
jgi:hypothetical protein